MQRRDFFTVGATLAVLAAGACAKSSAGELQLVEGASKFDASALGTLAAKPADVRQVWDVGTNPPAALSEIKNSLNGFQFGYGMDPKRLSIVACLHNVANIVAYDDDAWQKYNFGDVFGIKDRSGNAITTNIFAHARAKPNPDADPNDPSGMYQDPTLETLQRRGVAVFACHTGAAEHARMLAQNGGQPPAAAQSILSDLLAHMRPGVVVVPSAVSTLGLLQYRYRYSYAGVSA